MRNEVKKIKYYKWNRMQDNSWDNKTRFIYSLKTYDELIKECRKRFKGEKELKQYAHCRFYNFHSHNIVQEMFLKYSQVKEEENKKHRSRDFFIGKDPFDLKLSVYPKRLIGKNFTDEQLAGWLYKNQSSQQRHHLKGRIFVIVLDAKNPEENWRMKSNFELIEKKIKKFMKDPQYIKYNGTKCAVITVIQ